MRFLKKIIKTSTDFKGHTSLLIHSLEGCNLKCMSCHNYEELITKKDKQPFIDEVELIKRIKLSKDLVDAIIFSGGEFLMSDIDDIKQLLKTIKEFFKGKVIINTNGSFPNKIYLLSDLVDGFHMDIKLIPNHSDSKYYNEEREVLGIIDIDIYRDRVLSSIKNIKESNLDYSLFRTIDYPVYSDEYMLKIKEFCERENLNWSINEFIEV